ncbi:GlxA family transcriptional regulator [Mucilaginibacter celer]|uniref:Helix-turn-helix domain-containing protein n=1 Tax=Mucilaginibacter celer TaxID=2305508 RepID=A0A494VX64_9SPHI|nr:GlxA family transcriptional regulator [Mucilaginibacter celer]AYL95835.1 helix-turn-helix domain-containing protein [Mucilaginibacter celer]
MNGNPQKKKIVIVVMSGNMLLNFAGPSDVFANANASLVDMGMPEGYEVLIATATKDRKVRGRTGVEIQCPCCVMEVAQPIDTLIIAGNDRSAEGGIRLAEFHHWLSKIDPKKTRRIASVCGGAFALAKAGLLNGKKATTHWERSENLEKEYPGVQVEAHQFFVRDGNIYTSAGVSSGIDLSLAMVEEDYGRDIAIRVARKLVFYLSRPGFQSQFGNLIPPYEAENIAGKLQGWLKQHLHEPLDVTRIADYLSMSTRNFTRVFHKQTGISPAKFIEKLRVEAARKLLEDTDVPLERIAEQCGLINLVGMRRTFLRHLNVTPSDYRRTFRTALKDAGITELLIN